MKSLTIGFILSLVFSANFAMAKGDGQENCQTGPSKVNCEVIINDTSSNTFASTEFSADELQQDAYGCNVIKKAGNYTLIFSKIYLNKNSKVTNRFDVIVCPGNCGLQEPNKKAVDASTTLIGDTKEGNFGTDIMKNVISKEKITLECSIR